ncbi:hypothetical protein JYT15_00285 [Acidimicrobium ferrooxidans]|nr:hypothetical protein [Acidimicrobium ferrooxidans]
MTDNKIRFHCPACAKKIAVPLSMAARRGRCPQCKGAVTIPRADEQLPLLEDAGDTGEIGGEISRQTPSRSHRHSSR